MQKVEDRKEFHLSPELAAKYLSTYVADIDWTKHISRLWGRLLKRHGEQEAKELMRKIIACTVLLPASDKTKIPDNPENLLYWVQSYQQFDEEDWVEELSSVVERDEQISAWRNQCLSLGIVHPFQYSPVTRQAFNWLYSMAEETGAVTSSNKNDVEKQCRNLVLAYGGTVVVNVFEKHRRDIKRKILTWRNTYFFEHLIYDTYSFEQVFKIKRQELGRTNDNLVKQIRID